VKLTTDLHLGKGKAVPELNKHHTIKTYYGSGGTAPLIPNLGTRSRWV